MPLTLDLKALGSFALGRKHGNLQPSPTATGNPFSKKRGFPKIRGTIFAVTIIRTIVFWGLYWGPLKLGNYQNASTSRDPAL